MPDHVWGQGLWGQARWDTRTADQGVLALSGGSAALRLGRGVFATNGALRLSGQPITLRISRKLPAAAGTVALTGGAAALRLGRRLPAAAGTLALSGQAATLTYTHAPGANHYTMMVELGTLTLIGKLASLDVVRAVVRPRPPSVVYHMGRRRRDMLGPWVSR
jgi:hypothetical protein